jgi:CheY-like chemotaxis protein
MAGGQPQGPAPGASDDAGSGRVVVLVVDDEPLIRAFVTRALERVGIDVAAAENGRKALRLVADGEVRPTVLLTDIDMPAMGGVELAARMHALRPDIRIVMMTGDASRAAVARDRSAIVAAVLDKPILVGDLIAAVRPDPERVGR